MGSGPHCWWLRPPASNCSLRLKRLNFNDFTSLAWGWQVVEEGECFCGWIAQEGSYTVKKMETFCARKFFKEEINVFSWNKCICSCKKGIMTPEKDTTSHEHWPRKCQIKVRSKKRAWSGRRHQRDATRHSWERLESKQPDNTKDWVRMEVQVEQVEPSPVASGDTSTAHPLWETSWQSPKLLNTLLTFLPAILFLAT